MNNWAQINILYSNFSGVSAMSTTGEFKCGTCGLAYASLNDLHTHRTQHKGDKIYDCVICGKTLRRKFDLQIHMRLHTGEKPYSCEICGKSFSIEGNYMRHQIVHLKTKMF